MGDSCFSGCPQLISIDCDLEPEKFTCSGCCECPVCFHDVEACLQRGRSGEPKEVELDHEALDKVLKKFQVGITVQQALDAEEG